MHLGTEEFATVVAVVDCDRSGLVGGTTVMTLDGEMPVEHLNVGDRVITRDTGMAVLRAIKVSDIEIETVKIRAGSLGHTRPDRDMIVCRDTLIHIRDWRAEALFGQKSALIPARRVADGEFVATQPKSMAKVFTLVFDRQHVLYADGIEVASAEV
jgi:hypothetical protein